MDRKGAAALVLLLLMLLLLLLLLLPLAFAAFELKQNKTSLYRMHAAEYCSIVKAPVNRY